MEFLFGGRLGRGGYLGCSLAYGLFIFLTLMAVGRYFEPSDKTPFVLTTGTILFFAGLWLLNIFVGLVLTVKRLHDFDLSGWFYLAIVLLQSMLFGLAFGFHSKDLHAIAWGSQLLIWFLMCAWPGTPGANRYGER